VKSVNTTGDLEPEAQSVSVAALAASRGELDARGGEVAGEGKGREEEALTQLSASRGSARHLRTKMLVSHSASQPHLRAGSTEQAAINPQVRIKQTDRAGKTSQQQSST